MALLLCPEMITALVDVDSRRQILAMDILEMCATPSLRWKLNICFTSVPFENMTQSLNLCYTVTMLSVVYSWMILMCNLQDISLSLNKKL